jgi:hypothetical protein
MARLAACLVAAVLGAGCGQSSGKKPVVPPCDATCRDRTAALGFRETLKLAFNLTLQGNDAGPQDESTPCLGQGEVRVHGTATSNAEQGAMDVDLIYDFTDCRNLRVDETPTQSYDLVISGTVQQRGVIAVQPSATTALFITSEELSLEGTVYDPAIDFSESGCVLELQQDGNHLSGSVCGRTVGVGL